MGQITTEISHKLNRTYRIISENSAVEVLSKIEHLIKQENSNEDDKFHSLRADREELVEDIARELRQGWNRK